jgi:hypothetical protein
MAIHYFTTQHAGVTFTAPNTYQQEDVSGDTIKD